MLGGFSVFWDFFDQKFTEKMVMVQFAVMGGNFFCKFLVKKVPKNKKDPQQTKNGFFSKKMFLNV